MIIGSFALQGINGVRNIVIFLSSSSSIVLHAIIPGTLHPEPTINGINDFPLKPIFSKYLVKKKGNSKPYIQLLLKQLSIKIKSLIEV